MFLFNFFKRIGGADISNLNTSYVSIQLQTHFIFQALNGNLNTSYVSIQCKAGCYSV